MKREAGELTLPHRREVIWIGTRLPRTTAPRAVIPKDKARANVHNVPWPSITVWQRSRHLPPRLATRAQPAHLRDSPQNAAFAQGQSSQPTVQPEGWPCSLGVRPGRLPITLGGLRLNIPARLLLIISGKKTRGARKLL